MIPVFASQAVGIKDVLVRYSWDGDANLDGVVNADDYFQIDSGFISQKKGYYNGDFNYDGVVSADDYFLIDSAFIGQSEPLVAGTPSQIQLLTKAESGKRAPSKRSGDADVLSELFSVVPDL